MTDQIPLLDVDPAARRDFDYYPTPAWMTRALCRRELLHGVLEPCVGDGSIVRALCGPALADDFAPDVVATNDVNPAWAADHHLDATARVTWVKLCPRPYRAGCPYWVVTNPPFNLADEIVPLAIEHAPCVAMLLRLSWLEPTEARARFLEQHPPTRLIVMPRHDFRGNGSTDSVTSAWFIWNAGGGRKGIDVVTKAERDELIARGRS